MSKDDKYHKQGSLSKNKKKKDEKKNNNYDNGNGGNSFRRPDFNMQEDQRSDKP